MNHMDMGGGGGMGGHQHGGGGMDMNMTGDRTCMGDMLVCIPHPPNIVIRYSETPIIGLAPFGPT